MEKKWDYTIENAQEAFNVWFGTKRGLFRIGSGLTEANQQANTKIYKLTGSRMKAWFDLLDKEGR
jgi:hypothetical protein